MRFNITAGIALLLPLMACETTPTSVTDTDVTAAFGVVENARFPFDAVGFEACGEIVDIFGEYHVVVSEVVNRNGRTHLRYHINAKGRGVSRTSGATYQWNDNINETIHDGPLPATFQYGSVWKVIGKGPAPNFKLQDFFHFTLNANGEPTAVHDKFVATCR